MCVGAVTSVTWCHAVRCSPPPPSLDEAGSPRRLILLTSPGELSLPSARRTPARRATDRTGECFWITTLLIKFPVLRARSELRRRQ